MTPAEPTTPASAEAPGQAAGPREEFEPSAHDELRAEQEARAAIQDAFSESAGPEPIPSEPEPMAPEPTAEAPDEDAAEASAEAIQEAFTEAAEPEPMAPEPPAEAPDEEAAEAPAEAIQDAFSEAAAIASEPLPDTAPELAVEFTEEWAEPAAPAAAPEPTPPVEVAESAAAEPMPGHGGQPGEEELMWLGDEFEAAGLEVAAQGWRSADAPARPTDTPVLELSDAELSQLAADEGWDAAEVEAIRSLLGRPNPTASTPLVPQPAAVEPEPPPAAPEPPAPVPTGEDAAPSAAAPRRHSMSSMNDPQWLKGRRGPAATAYRRLRRLFPG
jgi:hypothetical protein